MKKTKFKLALFVFTAFIWLSGCGDDSAYEETSGVDVIEDPKSAPSRPTFNKSKDILLAQFDGRPDADDIHSVAALGCMLRHPDLSGVKFYAVQGAYGTQPGKFIQARNLYNKAFGAENTKWTDADKSWNQSLNRVFNKVKPVLNAGGKVWVQEAGQSSFTKGWIAKLLASGVSSSKIKSSVIVVQHSKWNEDKTKRSDLNYVKQKAKYIAIDDGNWPWGKGPNRGPNTPNYKSSNKKYLRQAKNSSKSYVRNFWRTADSIIKASGFNASHSTIPKGGIDYSDCVENTYIFRLESKAGSVDAFWNRYVINKP